MLNRILDNSQTPVPEVGMGVTRLGWTDRHPYTVVEVRTPKKIVVRADKAVRTDKNGLSESQTWEITPDPEGEEVTLTLRIDGKWRAVGEGKGGTGWMLGARMRYCDPHF